jgi:hypothetical protein
MVGMHTPLKKQKGIKVMFYARNTFTTIKQEDIRVMSYGSNVSYRGVCNPTI